MRTGKNFSLLIGRGGQIRLAPLYDIASFLPYADDPRRLKLSNRIGGKYRLDDIGRRQWGRFGAENALSWDPVSACRDLAGRVLDALPAVVAEAREGTGDNGIIERLAKRLANRAGDRPRPAARSLTTRGEHAPRARSITPLSKLAQEGNYTPPAPTARSGLSGVREDVSVVPITILYK